MSERPGRNDPCHCGSGSKYKKCCLEKDEADRVAAAAKQAATAAAAAATAPPVEAAAAAKPKHAPKPDAATRRIAPAARRRSV